MAGYLREALTDDDLDEQAVSITSGRPESTGGVGAAAASDASTPAAAAPQSEVEIVLGQLRDAGLPFIDSDDPIGTVTLASGEKITLRELNGEDETYVESFMDHYNVKPDGAGRSTSLRFMSLCSIDTINGEQRAPVDRLEFLRIYLNRFKRADLARIVAAYIKLSLTAGGSTFRPQG